MKNNGQLTADFHVSEFACNDGTQVPAMFFENVQKLAKNLQVIRDEVKSPIYINSGYRHETYNKRIGGAKHSQHLTASAADIVAENLSPSKLRVVINKLIKQGKLHNGGIGAYKNFTHYDIRLTPARW